MAKTALTEPPAAIARLVAALQREFPGAEISTEHIRGNRYRIVMVWDEFTGVAHPERQSAVWATAGRTVNASELLDVGMILTVSPDELPDAQQE